MGAKNNQKYFFTPELREDVRRAYCFKKRELTAALDRLAAKTGWPRWAFKLESARMGWTTRDHRRNWTAKEDAYLREFIGHISTSKIAKNLGRSFESVQARCPRLELSTRAQDGYNMADLQKAFGEPAGTIRKWMEQGLFGKVHRNYGNRVAEKNVIRFIRQHAAEYDLRRVDQVWFKGLVFWANQNCGPERFALSMRKR